MSDKGEAAIKLLEEMKVKFADAQHADEYKFWGRELFGAWLKEINEVLKLSGNCKKCNGTGVVPDADKRKEEPLGPAWRLCPDCQKH